MFESVRLDIPADPAYVGLLRSACSHVAAVADLTIEEIEDLRIAVSEAVTMLIPHATEISCLFTPSQFRVAVECSAQTTSGITIDQDDLGWVILSSLVSVEPSQTDSRVSIHLAKEREQPVS